MPISHEDKIIFVHIPKTGGASIEKSLGIFGNDNNGNLEPNFEILYGQTKDKILQHLKIEEIKKLKKKEFETFKLVSFVRNPYERVLSKYYHDVKIARPDKPGSTRDCNNFNDWIIKHQRGLSKFLRTQYSYVYDKNGNNLADFIGKFENFENDVQIIKEKLGLKAKLEHKNKNPIKKDIDWLSEYTQQGLEIVNRTYLCDFKVFNYEMKY